MLPHGRRTLLKRYTSKQCHADKITEKQLEGRNAERTFSVYTRYDLTRVIKPDFHVSDGTELD